MGIGPDPQRMLRELRLPKGFTVIELGSQLAHNGTRRDPNWKSWPAREFYEELGCSRYESIDANGEATITADLNRDLWGLIEPWEHYDLVTDFGTSEHCFNVARAWETMHELCKPGGLIVGDKPAQGYPQHGFYRFDKIFFYGVATFNGYKSVHFSEVKAGRGTCWRFAFRTPEEYKPFVMPHQGKWSWKVGG